MFSLPIVFLALSASVFAGPTGSQLKPTTKRNPSKVGLTKRTARTSSPSSSCLIVGSGQEYTTISAAVSALGTTSDDDACIFIEAGTYTEQVYITYPGALTIYGYTEDTADYSSNEVTITYDATSTSAGSDDASGTLRVHKDNFALYNVNVINSYGTYASHTQAIAVSAYGSEQGYYACQIIGYQDTLLAEEGTQYYGDCYIQGAVDYIFGQTAQAYFKRNYLASSGPGTVTASGRDSSTNPSYYVFDSCYVLAADDAVSETTGEVFLGRPWAEYARVIFKYCDLTDVVNPAHWEEWSSTEPNTEYVLFGEYDNTGAEASDADAVYVTILTADDIDDYSIEVVLGSDYADWVDETYD